MSLRRPPELVAAYRSCGRAARAHTAVRWATAPMEWVESALPADGDLLEVGSGHGLFSLFAALRGPRRTVEGVDVDAGKVSDARTAAAALGLGPSRVRFEHVGPGWRPEPGRSHRGVVIIDVLYLLGHDAALELCAAAADAVADGGVLVVKEMDTTKRWRCGLLHAQEVVATRVTRITEGSTVELVPLDDLADCMRDHGLAVEVVDLSAGSHVPHAAVVGRRARDEVTGPDPLAPWVSGPG